MARVVVGVPVYNGVSLIGECLESLVSQTYDDMEIVVSDNASTDGTSEICEEYANKYPHIRHVRHAETSDSVTNFNFLLDNGDSELFMWRAYDDLSTPGFVEAMVQNFAADPSCELAVGAVKLLSITDGQITGTLRFPYPDTTGLTGLQRIEKSLMESSASWFYGLWNRKVLQSNFHHVLKVYPGGWGADHLSLFPLILRNTIRGDDRQEFVARIEITKERQEVSYGFGSADMIQLRQAFLAEAGIEVQRLNLSQKETKALLKFVEVYLDRILFSRSKIRRTRLRESIPFGLGQRRRKQ